MREHLAIALAAVAALACGGRPAGPAPLASASAPAVVGASRTGHTATLLEDGRVLVVGGASPSSAALATVELVDPASGRVTTAAPLAAARHDHTATLLGDGRVLVAGGASAQGAALASVELFDPAAGTWSAGPALAAARAGHTATRLPSGEVLVAGGEAAGAALDSAEKLAADASGWSTAGTLSAARSRHGAALLPDGTVLVAGGEAAAAALASSERFDPVAGGWTASGPLATARAGHVLAALFDGTVVAAGGEGASGPLASVERWSKGAGDWAAATPLSTARADAAAVLVPSGKLLVVGGRAAGGEVGTSELFDPAGGGWAEGPALTAARSGHSATALTTGRVLVVGGELSGAALGTLEALELLAPSWADTAATSVSRRGHTATQLPDGRILVAGGIDGFGGYLADAQLYDPSTGAWTGTGSMLAARTDHTATLLESGEVLVIGGAVGSGTPLAAAELYSPATGRWRSTGGLRHARTGHTAVLLPSGVVLVAGGETSTGADPAVTQAVELYDPEGGSFAAGESLAVARARHTATLLPDGDVLVAGGQDAAGAPLASCERWGAVSWKWTAAPALAHARARHATTVLEDGRLLTTGGAGADGPLASTELFTSASGWAAGPALATARTEHAALLLPTGDVLVAGGRGAGELGSAERWDPWTAVWHAAPPLQHPRAGLTLTLLPDGDALATGGDAGDLVHVGERFDAGLGVAADLAPTLDGGLPARTPGTPLALTGARLAGGPEAAGGARASAANHPILRMEGVAGPVSHARVASFAPAALDVSVPAGTAPGWYFLRPQASGVPGPSRALLVLSTLKISPRSPTVAPKGEVAFVAAGGFGYVWSLETNASGATLDPDTGAYVAGETGGVVDVVKVTDGTGHSATASVAVGPPLAIGENPGGAEPGQQIAFEASGGSGGGYTWSLVAGDSGSTLDPVTGVYTAGDVRNAADLVRVTDSLGNVAEVIVYVWPEWKLGGDGCSCGAGGLSGSPVAILLAALALGRLRRRRPAAPRALALLVLAALAPAARAQETSTAIVLERFEPLGGARDVLSVGSAEVAGHLERSAGVSFSYAARPLRLEAQGQGGSLEFAIVERQATLAAGVSVGLFGWAEVAVIGSGSVAQSAGHAPNVPATLQPTIASNGLSDLRIVPKLRLGALGPLAAAVAVPVTIPTGDSRSFLGAGAPTYGPKLLVEAGLGRVRLLGSAGYVVRPERTWLDAKVGSAITYGAAAELPFRRFAVQASLVGERGSGAGASPLEALLAVRWEGPRGLGVTAGGGPGITAGYGTPEWRGFLALTYSSLAPVRLEPPAPADLPAVPLVAVEEPAAPAAQGRRAPAAVPLPPPPLMAIDARIYFPVNDTEVSSRFQEEIDRVAAEVRANPKPVKIVVEGHADEVGNPRHNQALSEQRAERVRAALEAAGVPAERLRAIGYGDTRPAMPGHHAMNRRVELRIE